MLTDHCDICGPLPDPTEYITVAGPTGPIVICADCAELFNYREPVVESDCEEE